MTFGRREPDAMSHVTCTECDRPIGDDGRGYSDGTGELVPYCAACAAQEFGEDTPPPARNE